MTLSKSKPVTYELGVPAVMPLAAVRLSDARGDKTCLLGVALQHPPIHLDASRHPSLDITGGRADIAHAWAVGFLQTSGLEESGKLEIELAIPAHMGLGSDACLGLAVARALAWVHQKEDLVRSPSELARGLGLSGLHALEHWAFSDGGLLLTETDTPDSTMPALVQRAEIDHPEKEAWAFVFLLPRPGPEVPKTLELDRLSALVETAAGLSSDGGRLVADRLWPAIAADNLTDFGVVLSELQDANRTALRNAGHNLDESAEETEIIKIMNSQGAVAAGRMPTGLGLFGLVRGGQASRELRKALRDHVGHMGGIVMATITDNRGAHSQVRDGRGNILSPG